MVFGCAQASSRQLFKVFGNLPEAVIHEDNVLPLRSVLAGRLMYVKEPLVKYRVHGSNLFIKSRKRRMDLKTLAWQEDRMRRDYQTRETMYAAFLRDLEIALEKRLIGLGDYEKASQVAARRRRCQSLIIKFLETGFFDKCRLLAELRREQLSKQEWKTLARRLVPRPILLRIQLARSYAALTWSRSS
jgi:hypothetical protein